MSFRYELLRWKRRASKAGEGAVAAAVRLGFAVLRSLGPDRAAGLAASVARNAGPLFSAHRIALDNVRHAFPELSDEEQRRIVRQAWDNLGRTASEYVHMDRIWDVDVAHPERTGRIELAPGTLDRFMGLQDDGKPALIFGAHLANWELPALAGPKNGLPSAILYRTPNNKAVARDILALRRDLMGTLVPAGMLAPMRLIAALEEGKHVGMVVDQRFGRGPRVPFLGRPAAANPLLAELARRFDCPVHGTRAIRLPGGRFRLELTEALNLPRDAEGRIDVEAATAMVNRVIEGWVREHPGQWLWMHRRWR